MSHLTHAFFLEHAQDIQDLVISENSAFVREWPLGLRGALPDDLIQNAKIMALEERNAEIDELQKQLNRMEVEIGGSTRSWNLRKNCSCSVAM